jgi:hypothetical protein
MRASLRLATLALVAQTGLAHAQGASVMTSLLKDMKEVEEKVIGLAKAMPDAVVELASRNRGPLRG